MNKYYLLTFNEDWADEHNVPALECFSEEEFEKWKKVRIGVPREGYAEKIKEWNQINNTYKAWSNEIAKHKLGSVRFTDFPPEFEHLKTYPKYPGDKPTPFRSLISAYLGNNGDYFEERFEEYEFAGQLLDDHIDVIEVDENFYNTFKKAGLSRLSLTNIFNIDFKDYGE